MSLDVLTNRGEYLPAHYLDVVFPKTLAARDGLLAKWHAETQREHATPRSGLASLRRDYLDAKVRLAATTDPTRRQAQLRDLHQRILSALGYHPKPGEQKMVTTAGETSVAVAHADRRLIAVDCGWADTVDAASDLEGAGRLLTPVEIKPREHITVGTKLASCLFAGDAAPHYVLILNGSVVTLADRRVWGEGRYLAVDLDLAFARNDTSRAGELDIIAALLGADSLYPPAEGGDDLLTTFLAAGRQHAVGVSGELREGLKRSVELIANEVLARLAAAGVAPQQIMDSRELGRRLTTEALRYLYRILFLLYAESRPELGVLPVDYPEYVKGYSMARLGDLVTRNMVGESARTGFHLYESLDLLFRMVNDGHRPLDGVSVNEEESHSEGIRFERLRSDLFLPQAITLIGPCAVTHPDDDPDDRDARTLDTRLRNQTMREVLRLLMLAKGKGKQRGGFISYAQLGINQLGAVYEGLMSYTGFIATEELYEVAKAGDPKDGSWMVPASAADSFDDSVFVREPDGNGHRTGRRVRYPAGSFVYRLAGRDRQTSASYYTPQSLTEVTVQLVLKYRLDQDGATTPARELLDWTICEPALGSGAFLNEAINQVATEYLRRRQAELGTRLDPERYLLEKQRVKAYIAIHNCYGVDLNRTAVELAEVSLWLNVMHPGLQAPWFGLHLRRGNSLVGGNRRYYTPQQLAKGVWLTTAPTECPFRDGALPAGVIHHFLLPADGWGIVATEKEAKALAPDQAAALALWRRAIKKAPDNKGRNSQVKRLQGIAGRVEFLWGLVRQRLAISEREIRRHVPVWEAEELPVITEAVEREKILADLEVAGTPYWRLKTLMDAWCALWFWPLDKVGLLDGTADVYQAQATVTHHTTRSVYDDSQATDGLFDLDTLGGGNVEPEAAPTRRSQVVTRPVSAIQRLDQRNSVANLDHWLDFVEALVGRSDFSELFGTFHGLEELSEFEEHLVGAMGMDQAHRLPDRFPWLDTAIEIAENQGFFHWELTFAHVFGVGGFDLQIGNPPWVRPTWDEGAVLAEIDPWFQLADKPSREIWTARKEVTLQSTAHTAVVLSELAVNAALGAVVSSRQCYPEISGTQPDLYRGFMARVWSGMSTCGVGGLIHPDTHLTGVKEGRLREAAYRHLRIHGTFVNVSNWAFPDLSRRQEFGVHIYGSERPEVEFLHACQLHAASVLTESLTDDGTGELPGQKVNGAWDVRAHRDRLIQVDSRTLQNWRMVLGDPDIPLSQVPLLNPITTAEEPAIAAIGRFRHRLGEQNPRITAGYHEANSKKLGLIEWKPQASETWRDVIFQGPHFGIATPIAKRPDDTVKSNNDWSTVDLASLPADAYPRTNYVRACAFDKFVKAQDHWVDQTRFLDLRQSDEAIEHGSAELLRRMGRTPTRSDLDSFLKDIASRPSSDFYRIAWRSMIDPKGSERSLYSAIIPPGCTHVHAVHSLSLGDDVATVLNAGFWASLPLDYLLRITGRSHLQVAEAMKMPAPDPDHPLSSDLLLRILRLNCLTQAYAPLWRTLFREEWGFRRDWVASWPSLLPLSDIGPNWTPETPLRTEYARYAALVEIDALVAVWLGIAAEELITIYRSRYPILSDREAKMYFDANGRRLAADPYAFGYGQTKEHWTQLEAHLSDSHAVPPPKGYTSRLYEADRESKMRQAHAAFTEQLNQAQEGQW